METQEARHLAYGPKLLGVGPCVKRGHALGEEQETSQSFDPLPLQRQVHLVGTRLRRTQESQRPHSKRRGASGPPSQPRQEANITGKSPRTRWWR